MEKLVEELHKVFRLKSTTEEGDIVVVLTENPQTLTYAVVSGFERDTAKVNEWWHVTMQLVSVPPQQVTWTLRTPQFTGEDIFTMGGEKRYIKAVDFSEPNTKLSVKKPKVNGSKKPALRVVK